MGIAYYAIFDPLEQAQDGLLRVYALDSGSRTYAEVDPSLLPEVGLGLIVWRGSYEGREDVWIRWQDSKRTLIPTGAEQAEQERLRAEQAQRRAEQLAARLRTLGIDPNARNGDIAP